MALYPSTNPIPKVDGTRYSVPPCLVLNTYSLSMILEICSAIVASVPIPLRSIKPTRSASVKRLGAVVWPSLSWQAEGRKVSPG